MCSCHFPRTCLDFDLTPECRGGGDEAEITRLGHSVAVLPDAGHWVHTDNPAGLLALIAPSFGAARPPTQTPAAAAQYQ